VNDMSAVILIAGDGGTGKTDQSKKFPEPLAHCNFEFPKGYDAKSERIITTYPCREIHGYKLNGLKYESAPIQKGFKKGQINVSATYELIKTTIDDVLDHSGDFETISLDSISDIREIVSAQWLIDYRKKGTKEAGRKSIGKDPSAWSAINKIVCDDLLFPIINIGRIENKNIVFTARNTDEYKVIELETGKEETAKTGKRIIDAQDWLSFEIDVIAQLEANEKGSYSMMCKKTPVGVITRMDITGKTIFDILEERGVM